MVENYINKLLVGNALTKLRQINDDSIDLIITSHHTGMQLFMIKM